MSYLQGLVKSTLVFTAGTEIANMTQHYFKDAPAVLFDGTARAALAAEWNTWWDVGNGGITVAQKSFHPAIVTFARVDITEYTSAAGNGSPVTNSVSVNLAGNGGTTVLPAEVALCLTKRTLGSGPRHRGRVYLPYFTTGSLTASSFNVLAASAQDCRENYAICLQEINANAAIGANAVVFSFAGSGTDLITSIACGNQWDTQRRRGNQFAEAYAETAV